MKREMITGLLIMTSGVGLAQSTNLIDRVRSSIATVVSALPQGIWGEPSQIREFGTDPCGHAGYYDMVDIVSNNQDFVCSNFNACATNEISRMMLLSAWWGGNDALFIAGLSRCLDLVVAGTIPQEDLTWYRFGHGSDRRACVLSLKYNEPGVSNLVVRLCGYTGETNACRRILSGEARISVTNYLWQSSH